MLCWDRLRRLQPQSSLAIKASLAKALCERSLAKRLSVVAPEFRVHVNHHQKDTIPGYTAELGYQVGQLRAE